VTACLCCLGETDGADYHRACLLELFGQPRAPAIDVDLARLHTLALAMVGHVSLSGVQRKVSVGFDAARATLRVVVEGGHYLLKPQATVFPDLPQNEHVTTRIAALAAVEIPPCGLVRLADGSLGFLSRRFDRTETGKRHVEDFCQLAGLSPKQRYEGSAERCGRLVLRYATEPGVEALRLLRMLVVAWWTGNGDLHLKNLSLLRDEGGRWRLSPAYDLVCTRLVLPDDQLALPVAGNRKAPTRREWLELAQSCGVPTRAAARVLGEVASATEPALALVERCQLPAAARTAYRTLLRERGRRLAAVAEAAARRG
jgi:serine/threonine-protein kinase HipA